GARVILACRDVEKGNAVAVGIRVETHNPQVLVHKLDLSNAASIREFAERINKDEEKLNILINNAGVMTCPFSKTTEGFEMQFGVNHLGKVPSTRQPLTPAQPPLAQTSFVTSGTFGTNGWDFFFLRIFIFNPDLAIELCKSSLAQLPAAVSARAPSPGTGVTVNSLHPGSVMTDLQRHLGVVHAMQRILWPLSKSPAQGAQTSIHCAVAEELANVTGVYFSDCAPKSVSSLASDDAAAQKLWALSCKLLGIKWD
uniref:Retinol dehydrogenase 12, like n=1 Tax=Petromyzon marinus TaxID=7757 RepID=S4RHN6_PETMA